MIEHEEEGVRHFSSGAKRSSDVDELRYSLIPACALRRWAKRLAMGEAKYGTHNWQKGFPWSVVVDHMQEHLQRFVEGDTSEDHLAAILCNAGFLIWYDEHKPETCDLVERLLSMELLDEPEDDEDDDDLPAALGKVFDKRVAGELREKCRRDLAGAVSPPPPPPKR